MKLRNKQPSFVSRCSVSPGRVAMLLSCVLLGTACLTGCQSEPETPVSNAAAQPPGPGGAPPGSHAN
jgi:hypothetical protein